MTETHRGATIFVSAVLFVLGLFFGAWGPKSLFLVLMAIAAFGHLLRPMGLVVAAGVLIFMSSWAGHEFKWKEVTFLYIGLAIFVVWVFVHGLGLSMNVWPGVLGF